MFTILAITGPIHCHGIGFSPEGPDLSGPTCGVGHFDVKLALPALLFAALSQRPIADIVNGRYLGAYAGSLIALCGRVLAICPAAPSFSVLVGLGMSFQ
jgi:hypothetical protein